MTNKLEISRELLTILADLNCPYDQLMAAKQRAAEILAAPVVERQEPVAFQPRVKPWLLDCFGPVIAVDCQERNHRFLEEALELVQACGATAGEAHQLVDYVYGRDIGDPFQEVGGVMVTLAALCLAHGLDMHAAGETELARIWTKVDQIRAKQAAKPAMSPLPGAYPDREQPAPVAAKAAAWTNPEGSKFIWGSTMEDRPFNFVEYCVPLYTSMPAKAAVVYPSVDEVMKLVMNYQDHIRTNVTGTTNWAANLGMHIIDKVKELNQ